MQAYQHRPLNLASSEIRLVRVEKSDTDDAAVTLTLRHHRLDADTKFNALSYTWGEEWPLFPVTIQDELSTSLGTFHVRRNLYEYLHAARHSTEAWGSDWIWIDQICINQEEHKERCHQVNQMEKLYTTAQATIVWPGHPTMSELNALGVEQSDTDSSICGDVDVVLPSHAISRDLLRALTDYRLAALITAPYWNRLWIIQEVILASMVFIIIEGNIWPLQVFEDAIDVALRRGSVFRRCAKFKSSTLKVQSRLEFFSVHRQLRSVMSNPDVSDGEDLDLQYEVGGGTWDDALVLSEDTICAIPLDRVYGLMGLVPRSLRVPPDYSISMKELLSRVLQQVASESQGESFGRVWRGLYDILKSWKDFVGVVGDPLTDQLSELFQEINRTLGNAPWKDKVGVILHGIGISLPANVPKARRIGFTVPPTVSHEEPMPQLQPWYTEQWLYLHNATGRNARNSNSALETMLEILKADAVRRKNLFMRT